MAAETSLYTFKKANVKYVLMKPPKGGTNTSFSFHFKYYLLFTAFIRVFYLNVSGTEYLHNEYVCGQLFSL